MLKIKTITTDKATLLVVEMPEGITEIGNTDKRMSIPDRKGGHHLVYGKWQLIERLPEITEEQADKVVDSADYDDNRKLYTNYVNKRWTAFALNSLSSLLQVNEVYFENPYQDPGLIPTAELDVYRKAQSKVWDKERTYLFIKAY